MQVTRDRTDLPQIERGLKARRQALRQEIHDSLLRSRQEGHAEIAGQVHGREDEALADLLVDINLAEVTRDFGEVRDIDAALKRISLGTYGVCIDCAAPIAPERLQAYPTAKRCTACQQRREKLRASSPIPKL
jgi:RNA polymerase-binding transcription factor DksA